MRAGKLELSCPLGMQALSRIYNLSCFGVLSHIINPCSVKMAGYWTSSWSINTQKKNLANIQPSWSNAWPITHTYSFNIYVQIYSLQPRMLLITCMDSRLCPTNFTQADPGDMFIVRNPGNVMPHNQLFGENHHSVLSERAALELAISTGVQHIAVCGHSDCKVTPWAWCYGNLMLQGAHNQECILLILFTVSMIVWV